jgi:hypothetical protein
MLPSTINTGSYVIEKYSRSNPSNVSAPTQSQGLTTGQSEWEHFAHPNMSLTLDVKKSMDNTYESVRLRIIWNNMNKGRDGTRGEVIMVRTSKAHICAFSTQRVLQEDLDLLSFSNLDSQGHSAHGPPLKAVYRGPVVGIRYLSPLTVPATSPNVRMTWLDLSCHNCCILTNNGSSPSPTAVFRPTSLTCRMLRSSSMPSGQCAHVRR